MSVRGVATTNTPSPGSLGSVRYRNVVLPSTEGASPICTAAAVGSIDDTSGVVSSRRPTRRLGGARQRHVSRTRCRWPTQRRCRRQLGIHLRHQLVALHEDDDRRQRGEDDQKKTETAQDAVAQRHSSTRMQKPTPRIVWMSFGGAVSTFLRR